MTVVTYRPMAKAAWRPGLRGKRAFQIGQVDPSRNGVMAVLAPILGLTVAGGAAYLGIRAGLRDSGGLRVIGWIVGISGIIAVAATLADLFYIGGMPRSEMPGQQIVNQTTTSPGTVSS